MPVDKITSSYLYPYLYSRVNLNILIVGLGASGHSVAAYLAKRHIPFAVADSRVNPPDIEKFKAEFEKTGLLKGVYLGEFDSRIFCSSEIDLLVVSPGVAISHPMIQAARLQGKKVIGDIELFAQEVKKYCPDHQIIGITGSNGKSTVTSLVGELLNIKNKVVVAGNIGLPVLTALDSLIEEEPELSQKKVYFVLELSSFQLETTESLELEVASILNITPNHLDRYSGFSDYAKSKQRIYEKAKNRIYHREIENILKEKWLDNQGITVALDNPKKDHFGLISENNQIFLAHGQEKIASVLELKLKGQHNYENVLFALAIVTALGIKVRAEHLERLKHFSGLAHRSEWIAESNQVQWINDSKGTSIGATTATIKGWAPMITGKIILIAGGDGKGANFEPLTDILHKYVKAVVLIGRDAKKIAEIVPNSVKSYVAEIMEKAVPIAHNLAQPGDMVLLSPVCASWDQYANYIERGEHFKSCVFKLINRYNSANH